MAMALQIIDRAEFEGHPVHVVSWGRWLYYIAEEIGRALGPQAGGDTFADDVVGRWASADLITNGSDFLLAPRWAFASRGLVERDDAKPVVLLRLMTGIDQALALAYDGDGDDWAWQVRMDALREAIGIDRWDPNVDAPCPLPPERLKVVEAPEPGAMELRRSGPSPARIARPLPALD